MTDGRFLLAAIALLLPAEQVTCPAVFGDDRYAKVDVNLDMKHVVGGVSDFGRQRHITVHSNLHESDWDGEAAAMRYLLDDLDVYLGRDNGQASWLFRTTPQDPKRPNHPDLSVMKARSQWFKEQYDRHLPERREYEKRSREMIMGGNPESVYPTLSWRPGELKGVDDKAGKYILRDADPVADWIAEYLDTFFREKGEVSGMPRPLYWEVLNEPDMKLNAGGHFMMSSWESLFDYHNLVAQRIRSKLGDRAPLIGGMTWGLHDLGSGDLYTRFKTQDYVKKFYGKTPADLAAIELAYKKTDSKVWERDHTADFFQWDVIWKAFMDTCGENMDFYSIHLYDWSPTGDDPRWRGGHYRSGGHVEAVLEMVEWYQQHRFGKPKPWVISEYGSIPTQITQQTDYRYADWMHVKTWNQMFLQILTRPDMVVKSMPFAPIKAKWGATTWPNGKQKRYEASLMQTDHADVNSIDAQWYFTDKIQWYELWSDVDGTRVDTWSSEPDIQVDCYVDGRHAYVILNNLEWENTVVDLSMFGANGNTVKAVRLKHSYLAEGLSPSSIGRGVLADATVPNLPRAVTLQPGSTMILDIEYVDPIEITHTSHEHKYYGESLASAGRDAGAIHRTAITQNAVTARVNGVKVPKQGEAMLRITGRFAISQAINPRLAEFTINGHKLELPTDTRMLRGRETQVYDFLGVDFEHTSHQEMRVLEIPIPLEYLKKNNEISVKVGQVAIYTNMNITVWDMSRPVRRSRKNDGKAPIAVTGISAEKQKVSVGENDSVGLRPSISPVNASDQGIHWTSSDLKVAVVDENGLVTGIGVGEATIRGVSHDGDHKTEATVTVTKVAPTSVEITRQTVTVPTGETVHLNIHVLPWKASNRAVTWASSAPAVATVSKAGVVTGQRPGTATITATTQDGKLSAKATIKVVPVALESIAIQPVDELLPLDSTLQFHVTFAPNNASNRTIRWTSSNESVATIDQKGLLTARGQGKTTIRAVSEDRGFDSTSVITVVRPVGSPVYVQAESFQKTGGPFEGFKIADKGGLINYNQTGDWAEYEVEFSEPGTYQFTLDAGTPLDNTGVEVFLNGVSVAKARVPNTDDWGKMRTIVVTNRLVLPKPGKHTIRIKSIGAAGAWQWNADRFGYWRLGSPSDTSEK